MVICPSCDLHYNAKSSFVLFYFFNFCVKCHMQNDLEEFFAMVNFTNPGILGDIAHFRRYYEVH